MEDIIGWLTTWHNLVYLLALGIACVYSGIQVILGIIPDAIDIDVDGDGDADIDVDLDIDGDDLADHASFISNAMSWVGVGKAPGAVLALTWLLIFGGLGILTSALVKTLMPIPVLPHLVNAGLMVGIFFIAGTITGRMASVLNRLLPGHSTVTKAGSKLVQTEGVAASEITEKGGQVELSGSRWVDAVTARGSIPKGTSVLLVDYDKDNTRYIAERY